MQRKTTIINQQKLFRDLPAWAELQDRKGSFEMHWELSDEFGKGFLYLAMFRPGLMLGLGDYYLRETISTFSENKNASFVINFTLSGSMACTFNYRSGNQVIYMFDPK